MNKNCLRVGVLIIPIINGVHQMFTDPPVPISYEGGLTRMEAEERL